VRNDPDPAPTPAGPAPTTAAPTQPTQATKPPAAEQRTLTAAGGSVQATCTSGDEAKLLSWTPTKPYKLKDVDPGPATAASAEFKHGNRTSTITVTCTGGIPSAA
jgi:serine/threonine-protein kinase